MAKKMDAPVTKIETISSYTIKNTHGWKVYFLSLDVNMKLGKVTRNRTINQVAFTKGNKISFSLRDKAGKDYKNILKPKVPIEAYNDEHLLVGNKDAKHKLLVFSDPFCPYCQEIVPKLIDDVKANPKIFALYYYHLPLLRIHPASDTATRAMLIFQKRGDLKHLKDMYHLLVNPREINADVVLKAIKDKTGIKIKRVDIYSDEINNRLKRDKKLKKRLMLTGTPTIFLDGLWDATRFKYKTFLPKK
ncbi:Secreted protein, suppressor for copper-sensitivity ScsC [hydrothermal vent metagenome]|uniref:Secreted protein, suppressor for copper-sensitivity ScsC n=1 Tax=hydrothermal vent metagenome TaxID=652676 RepID=A0A1W1CMZ2_9ZZZZ